MGFAKFDSKKIEDILSTAGERTKYYEGMGITLENIHSLDTVLKMTGLDFQVQKFPLQFMAEQTFTVDGQPTRAIVPFAIDDQFATVRTDTMKPLGVVGKNYEILQNSEMFDFLESLEGMDAKYETGGSYGAHGAKSFICMSTEPMKILGDDFQPYINFLNSFDGSGAVRVMFSPIRLFCSNCIAISIKKADRIVSLKHSPSLQGRLDTAKKVLLDNSRYLNALKFHAEKLAVTPFSAEAFEALLHELYPVKTEDKEIIQVRNMAQIEHLLNAYRQNDLQNFNNTAWKCIQAFADTESHPLQLRKTKTPSSFTNVVVNGMPLLNQVWDRMQELVVA